VFEAPGALFDNRRKSTMLYEALNAGEQRAWCGPTVVAAITGLAIPSVKARIKKARGHNGPVMGTSTGDLNAALLGSGLKMVWSAIYPKSPTVAQWLKRPRDMEAPYILNVGHHWVVVRGRWFCDTHTKGIPVRATKAPGRRRRVREAWKIVKA
jgi:hypothetical protein